MSKILIFGGTGFFGIELVKLLASKGHELTIFSRGKSPLPFEGMTSISGDRTNLEDLKQVNSAGPFDYIYDQICYCSNDAKVLLEALEFKPKKLIFTSTVSVYENGGYGNKESDVQLENGPIIYGNRDEFTYAKGKIQAEAVYLQKANFPLVCLRIPIVIGIGDTSKRIYQHIDWIKNQTEVYFPNIEASLSTISSKDAARVLEFCSLTEFTGSVNAKSSDLKLTELIKVLEEETGGKYKAAATDDNHSPYGVDKDWTIDTSKITELGFIPKDDILEVIKEIVSSIK